MVSRVCSFQVAASPLDAVILGIDHHRDRHIAGLILAPKLLASTSMRSIRLLRSENSTRSPSRPPAGHTPPQDRLRQALPSINRVCQAAFGDPTERNLAEEFLNFTAQFNPNVDFV